MFLTTAYLINPANSALSAALWGLFSLSSTQAQTVVSPTGDTTTSPPTHEVKVDTTNTKSTSGQAKAGSPQGKGNSDLNPRQDKTPGFAESQSSSDHSATQQSQQSQQSSPAFNQSPAKTQLKAPRSDFDERKAQIGVLPCGLRLIAAEDNSLPVAAVMLAIEIGTRDDPPELTGLVHALAFHLQQGNRELPPGGLLSEIHDAGGMATMAVGLAQVRFGSLVPVSHLQRTIWLESQRLRAPTIESGLWLKSLHFAGKDIEEQEPLPPELFAAAWQEMATSDKGRGVSDDLAQLTMQDIASHIARLFDYRRSTLVVVGPSPPQETWTMAAEQFADLPSRPRFPFRDPYPKQTQAREIPLNLANLPQNMHVWPLPLDSSMRFWARVLCRVIDRQKIKDRQGKLQRLHCQIRDDSRRPLMKIRVSGNADFQAHEYLRKHYQDLQSEIFSEFAVEQGNLDFMIHAPLDLATRLTFIPDFGLGQQIPPRQVELTSILGVPRTGKISQLPQPLFELLERSHSVYVNPQQVP